jgi:four helix bundle protein
MTMDQYTTKSGQLRERTTAFALRVMRLVDSLPRTRAAEVISRQLLRSATSVGANYRAACRGRSKAEFLAKLGIVEEEADECVYWIELVVASGLMKEELVHPLLQEANEIVSMIVASIRTGRTRRLH